MRAKFKIPCLHEAGLVQNFETVIPNYHPLTLEAVSTLLDIAYRAKRRGDNKTSNAVHGRLLQGIPGITCPCPVSVSRKERAVTQLYVEWALSKRRSSLRLARRLCRAMRAR